MSDTAINEERAEKLQQEKLQICREFGAWTAHNLSLGDGVFTIGADRPAGCGPWIEKLSTWTGKPLSALRIIDLACLEGLFAIEFAKAGAQVVGVEGREANIVKAQFVRDALQLKNLSLYHDDVRALSKERFGEFDVVFCRGILYHLDAPDVFRFIRSMAELCRDVAMIETHVALQRSKRARLGAWKTVEYEGRVYQGRIYHEHEPDSPTAERLDKRWASLDNPVSFWPTKEALLRMLRDQGFSALEEELTPDPERVRIIARP